MGILSHWPLILILVIVLIILGPGKLPQIGGAIGGAIKEFRKSTSDISDIKDEVTNAVQPAAPAAATTTAVAEKGEVPPQKEKAEAPRA